MGLGVWVGFAAESDIKRIPRPRFMLQIYNIILPKWLKTSLTAVIFADFKAKVYLWLHTDHFLFL